VEERRTGKLNIQCILPNQGTTEALGAFMKDPDQLMKVVDCAIATDGGSLYVCLSDEAGNQRHFTLNRSITSRGTASFNQVHEASDGQLSIEQRKLLEHQLRAILSNNVAPTKSEPLITSFIEHLAQPSA